MVRCANHYPAVTDSVLQRSPDHASGGLPGIVSLHATYACRLNQVERWFGIVIQMAIRRGSFSNVSDLVSKIELFVQHQNATATPFCWTATVD